jgi:hypothetical protein
MKSKNMGYELRCVANHHLVSYKLYFDQKWQNIDISFPSCAVPPVRHA